MEEGITTTKLYNGKIECKFFGPTKEKPNRHIYTMNGDRKRSVTGVIGIKDKSGVLVPWSQEMTAKSLIEFIESGGLITEEHIVKAVFASDEYKQKAADLGTEIHDWIEKYISFKLKKGKMPEMPEDKNVIKGTTSFLEWESEHKVKFLWAEKVLYSKKYDYMGKGDFGAVVDGEKCLCDIKTGNGMYKEVRLQTAAYRQADEEESKEKYDGRWAIQIAKETEEEYIKRMELKNRIKKFLGKKEVSIYPYQVFNAKFLDMDREDYKKDLACFLNLCGVQEWDSIAEL
jgi:hypothetical protein